MSNRASSQPNAMKTCCASLYELPVTRLLLGSSFHPGGLELTEKLARCVALGPGDRVLDLASGRGDTAFFLAERYGAEVVGLDYSSAQVKEANEEARRKGVHSQVFFVHGDAEALPFEGESFDFVFCECALCTFPRRSHAVREVYRVLRKGGSLALSDVVLNEEVPESLMTVMGHILCISGALSQDGYLEALIEGGFSTVHFRDASSTLLHLISQIEQRLSKLSGWSGVEAERSSLDLQEIEGLDREAISSALQAGRAFVGAGGLGYATFTSRK